MNIEFLKRVWLLCLCQYLLISMTFAQPNVKGGWSGIINLPIVPVAVSNLPNGQLLVWSSWDRFVFGGSFKKTYTVIFDPETNQPVEYLISNTQHDMFCPGINNLPDGRIFVVGGGTANRTSIFDPFTMEWVGSDKPNISRGYQGAVTLADGTVFTIGGSWSGGVPGGRDAEIWTPFEGWQLLPGLPVDVILDGANDPGGEYRADNHVWLWLAPNGKIFHAGPSANMHWIDASGNGSWTTIGPRGDGYSMCGTTVMYDIGKVLKAGGAAAYSDNFTIPNNDCYVLDINSDQVQVIDIPDMQYNRTFHNSVVLPNGQVLIFGGANLAKTFSDIGKEENNTPELYDPITNSWSLMEPMQVPRTYHSVAILLPDGRVFVGGGGLCGTDADCLDDEGNSLNHPDAEIFSPPYLFDDNGNLAMRPQILTSPVSADYHKTVIVKTDCEIASFSLIRFSSATHSTNNEQRRIPVTFQKQGVNTYELNILGANLLPPGYYMLFALNSAGVPSKSKNILIGSNIGIDEVPEYPCEISRQDWEVIETDSEQSSGSDFGGFQGELAIDNFPASRWQTNSGDPQPHEIQIDLKNIYDIVGFRYLPRQDGSVGGTILGYNFYVGTYNEVTEQIVWGSSVNSGTLAANTDLKEVVFSSSTPGRYIKMESTSAMGDGNRTTISEFYILAENCFTGTITQSINFSSISNKNVSDAPFQLNASASSGLPVSFSVVSGPAVLSDNNMVTLTGLPGEVVIRADQEGDNQYEAAPTVKQSFWVNDPSCPVVDLTAGTIQSHEVTGGDPEAGTAETSEDGTTLYITNNARKSISYSYSITPNTVLAFEFRTDLAGDTHAIAIGMDDDNILDENKTFTLLGGSNYPNAFDDFNNYTGNGYVEYLIPIGQFYTGSMDRIFFISEDITQPNDSHSYFRNIRVFENGACDAYQRTKVKIKVLLGGAYESSGGIMKDNLMVNGLVPSSNPYGDSPWNYEGEECIVSFPDECVDWVLVHLRDPNDPSQVLYQRTCLVKKDGTVMDTNGSEEIDFGRTGLSSAYVSVHHRNHLGVMTGSAIQLNQ